MAGLLAEGLGDRDAADGLLDVRGDFGVDAAALGDGPAGDTAEAEGGGDDERRQRHQ